MKNKRIVLMRHGESQWNQLNKFTGWKDISLSGKGKQEAQYAAEALKKNKFIFDIAYTSVLKRAIHTLWIILKKLDYAWIPVYKSWKLNERNYGSLEGLNKDEVVSMYGYKQVQLWRRSFLGLPPKNNDSNIIDLRNDKKYKHLKKKNIPSSENLKMTYNRVIHFWKSNILPQIKNNKNIIIVAHGNSLRALIKYLSNIDDIEIEKLDISTGSPIIYEFSHDIKPLRYYYL
ncbi:2,3-bisphosphoglycerate-dependent phosphoglycerate mutase [Buchnera aphidicola (Cinara pseudotaxifoliae)]|uniref:2,3-bisphosphoglycerate-dependent phosphoglycerate mutase n=1 Tax=Buchnera aphidicola (Cinara pseudotaxifoliae) TaxID=655384 RepID=A0A451DH16_9GAMM|nr:2,3-diphosphoglycerate-dependent phosphoglycerate mutase [Buchnera aphidicola]VFP85908.1 2,3-bisphosphoglycerate-dependent phosphoglycerate mutase [Buchnera aphidicola (Cinara pseudotaxifoliae)]